MVIKVAGHDSLQFDKRSRIAHYRHVQILQEHNHGQFFDAWIGLEWQLA